jgi:hypothetical protein
MPATTPVEASTVATAGLLDDHVADLLFEPDTVAVNRVWPPTSTTSDNGDIRIDTGSGSGIVT